MAVEYKSEEAAIAGAREHGWTVFSDGFGPIAETDHGPVVLLKSIRNWKSVYTWVKR